MTVTITCTACRRPHVATISAVQRARPCPFCGANAHQLHKADARACNACGEQLREAADLCGFCTEELAEAA